MKVDRCFDIEYPTRKYAIMLDLTPDGKSGKSALAFYTFKNGELIHNFIPGVGGMTGLASGQVSSPVAGMKYINWGYGSCCLFNPYRSVILMGEERRPGYSIWS